MLISELVTTSEPLKFRDDKYTLLFGAPNTIRDFLSSMFKAFKTSINFLVFGVLKSKSSTTVIALSLALRDKADFLANFFNFLFSLTS